LREKGVYGGGQYVPRKGGQFGSRKGGQFTRVFHAFVYKIKVIIFVKNTSDHETYTKHI